MIEVCIHSLNLDVLSNQPVVVLKSKADDRLLPIWIGNNEATAILIEMQSVETPRPLTHDLLLDVIETLDMIVQRVEITRLEEGTFYAALILMGEEKTFAIDARPSDSIALALRAKAPLFVADEVLQEAGLVPEEGADEEEEVERFREFLENVDPKDFGGSQS